MCVVCCGLFVVDCLLLLVFGLLYVVYCVCALCVVGVACWLLLIVVDC